MKLSHNQVGLRCERAVLLLRLLLLGCAGALVSPSYELAQLRSPSI
jgi:hypothetical protein